MRTDGLLATHHPDFMVQTAEATYMIETKVQDKVRDRNVQQKRAAAMEWCAKINNVASVQRDGRQWHYVIVGEDAFYGITAGGATFSDLCRHCMASHALVQGTLFDLHQ